MTLYDLINGAEIQGRAIVSTFDDMGENEEVLLNTECFDGEFYKLSEVVLSMEVAYIFATYSDDGAPCLKIELKPKEED